MTFLNHPGLLSLRLGSGRSVLKKGLGPGGCLLVRLVAVLAVVLAVASVKPKCSYTEESVAK